MTSGPRTFHDATGTRQHLLERLWVDEVARSWQTLGRTGVGGRYFAALEGTILSKKTKLSVASGFFTPHSFRTRSWLHVLLAGVLLARSEERRVGNECRSRWLRHH